ncbi:tape measure domain-containing protein [Pseudomonas fluvialis]|uniref:Tape measure domain-containing protein n=1 Tax=Pseudomonas fluvialis TaxID=1793966 RepID=A0A2I0CTH5_9PSED|nr:tape measure protein [Pseudomonas pharmacofabricae]PKF72669.1 tape measure domain-containing protein [Pseudomonas pharmacofabricae]
MSVRDRLIQLTLRARNFLSGDIEPATESMQALAEEGRNLKAALDEAGRARTLVRTLRDNQLATESLARAQADARATLDDLTREVADNATATAGQRIALREARRTLEEAERAYKKNQQAIQNTTSDLKKLGVDTDNVAAEEKRLTTELAENKEALANNRDAIKQKRAEEKKAADTAKDHAARIDAAKGVMADAGRKVLAFAAAYISLNAAFGLVQRGLNLVAGGIRSMLATGDQFELLDKRMASLMGSVAGGEQATAWIRDFAKNTPLGLTDVTEAFALLKSYGLDPMDGTLQALVDKNEQLGGGMERLQGIASALGQAYAKQKLQTEEILQLVERGVPVWSLLEKVTGKNAAQLQELASKGRLGRDVIAALTKEIGASAQGAAAENMGTLTGLMSNLSDTWTDFLGRIAKSGALDYAKQQLAGVAEYIEQMDRDGRLDRLAQGLSDAFTQGAERVGAFIKSLAGVDFNRLIDDSAAWLSDFTGKIDTATRAVTLLATPFRLAANAATMFLSVSLGAFSVFVTAAVKSMRVVAEAIPDAFGGDKVRAALKGTDAVISEFQEKLLGQIKQDAKDMASAVSGAWDTTTQSAVKNAKVQQEAAQAAEKAKADAAQATADKVSELNERFAAQAIAAAATGQRAIEGMADALQLINSASTVEQLEALRRATLRAFSEGRLSIEEYQQATGVLNGRFKELGSAAGGAAGLVSDLDDALGDLASVQAAISNAKTDVDINAIRAALRTLYQDGAITAAQYNEELKKTSDRQKELKGAVEQGAKAQQDKNKADEEAIVTSEQLRRESGKRMEAERKASGEAMVRRRKDGDDAKRDMSDMESFFGGVMTRAREPLAAMSAAALEAYDRLRGISSASPSIDTSSLEATSASLGRVSQQLGEVQKALSSPLSGPFGRWMLETQQASLQTQQAFLSQKASLQSLLRSYERGGMSARSFIEQARNAKVAMGLLDDSDLSALESAIASAQQRMQQMAESTRSTLSGLQDELDGLQGRQDDIERRRFAGRRRELQAQLAEAQAGGDSQAVANASRALGLLRQIESESEAKRQSEAQRARQEEQTKAKEAKPATTQAEAPSKVIRLEVPGRAPVDVAVRSTDDETKLLGILESAGLRSL